MFEERIKYFRLRRRRDISTANQKNKLFVVGFNPAAGWQSRYPKDVLRIWYRVFDVEEGGRRTLITRLCRVKCATTNDQTFRYYDKQ